MSLINPAQQAQNSKKMNTKGSISNFIEKYYLHFNAAALVESYRILLKKAHIGAAAEPQDEVLISTASENIVSHTHSLLDQVNELRKQLLLLDDEDGDEDYSNAVTR